MTSFMALCDKHLSPPPNYSNLTYVGRCAKLLGDMMRGVRPLKSFANLIKVGMMLIASIVFLPIAMLLKMLGYRFVNIDMSQIGSALFLDIFIREDILTKQTPRHKILVLASEFTDGNRYLMDLYNPYVTFVRNPFVKFLLSPFYVSVLFQDNSFNIDQVFFRKNLGHKIWNEYREKYNQDLVQFPETDEEKAKAMLSEYIPADKKFVALHVRDRGFYEERFKSTRNSDITTYETAVQYLIEQGYTVIRLGNPNASQIDDMLKRCGPLFFNYAHSDICCEMMDCYILSYCEFCIAQASGPSNIPPVFNTPSCNINWYNATNAPPFLEGDLVSFKRFRWKKDENLIPFERILEPPFIENPIIHELDDIGAYVEENSPELILETVREFLKDDRTLNDHQRQARSMLDERHYARDAKGQYSKAILREYFG